MAHSSEKGGAGAEKPLTRAQKLKRLRRDISAEPAGDQRRVLGTKFVHSGTSRIRNPEGVSAKRKRKKKNRVDCEE
ncbi:MAG: hypothetical protein AAB573_04685 [Patescibacteria group bacterium]